MNLPFLKGKNKMLEQISKFTIYKMNLYEIVINLLFGGFELILYPGSKLDTALDHSRILVKK